MAFGIDDALGAAAAGIQLVQTLVETIERYKKSNHDVDIELLIEEVRITALKRIDEADEALAHLDRTLRETKVNVDMRIDDVIAMTPFWRPFEQHRLKQIRKNLTTFSESIYSATDDIAALLRCKGSTHIMGNTIVESARRKHAFLQQFINAGSLRQSVELLRHELLTQKDRLK